MAPNVRFAPIRTLWTCPLENVVVEILSFNIQKMCDSSTIWWCWRRNRIQGELNDCVVSHFLLNLMTFGPVSVPEFERFLLLFSSVCRRRSMATAWLQSPGVTWSGWSNWGGETASTCPKRRRRWLLLPYFPPLWIQERITSLTFRASVISSAARFKNS